MDEHRILGKLNKTRDLRIPNVYTSALLEDLNDHSFDEERAPLYKGLWQEVVFQNTNSKMDLEIGTGNGTFFRHRASLHTDRNLIGVEIKYKPLIQTIRGCLREQLFHAKVIRYHALALEHVFEEQEVDDIFIHFPDPWTSPRKPKNRVLQAAVLQRLFKIQKPLSRLFFKTDSLEYFDFALDQIKDTSYKLQACTKDYHGSDLSKGSFITQFEAIFLKKNMKVNYFELLRK
jgi:tRNA (guanine-N7-)-methyltransferase